MGQGAARRARPPNNQLIGPPTIAGPGTATQADPANSPNRALPSQGRIGLSAKPNIRPTQPPQVVPNPQPTTSAPAPAPVTNYNVLGRQFSWSPGPNNDYENPVVTPGHGTAPPVTPPAATPSNTSAPVITPPPPAQTGTGGTPPPAVGTPPPVVTPPPVTTTDTGTSPPPPVDTTGTPPPVDTTGTTGTPPPPPAYGTTPPPVVNDDGTYVQPPTDNIQAWPDDRFTPLTTPELQYQSPDYNLPDSQFTDLPALAAERQQREQQEVFDYDPLTQQVGGGQVGELEQQLFGSRDNSQLPDLQRFLQQAGTGQGSRDSVEKAAYDRLFRQVEPQFRQQREQLTQNLVNRGIPIGSQAYNDAMNRMEQQQNRARENFALTATREGGAEQSRLYDLLSRGRGQLFGEETQGRAEQLAGRQQFVNEQANNFNRELQSQGFNRDTQQGNFNNLANMFGMERAARQDYFNEGNILSDEAARRRAQMYGEQQGQWNRDMQGLGFQQGVDQQGFQNNRQLFNEAMQRRQQGIGEYLTSRNQPISELQALLGLQRPTQQPQFPSVTQYSQQAPNLQGLIHGNYQNQLGAHNQQQQNATADYWQFSVYVHDVRQAC